MSISIRPFQPHDLQGVLRVLAQSMHTDAIPESRFVRQVLLDANFRPEGAPVAVRGDDDVIGFCLSVARQTPLENAPSDGEKGYVTLIGVRPSEQRRGVGSQLLAAAEAYLRSQGRKLVMVSSYAPGYFIPGVDVDVYPAGLPFFTKHGYKEIIRPVAMQTSLWHLRQPDWIGERACKLAGEGVIVSPFKPELTLPLLDFARQEFPGDWVRVVREAIARIVSQGDSPSRLIAAIDKDKDVGFSQFENERFGPIGVAASQRGRGLGQVLLYQTLLAQRDAGFRVAWFLWSDDKTAARLYNGAGFKEVRRFALLRKELA
jgi:GNAT superfamily N-acetyltransferase